MKRFTGNEPRLNQARVREGVGYLAVVLRRRAKMRATRAVRQVFRYQAASHRRLLPVVQLGLGG